MTETRATDVAAKFPERYEETEERPWWVAAYDVWAAAADDAGADYDESTFDYDSTPVVITEPDATAAAIRVGEQWFALVRRGDSVFLASHE